MSDTTLKADLFWDDADPEVSAYDISNIVDNYCLGEIVRIQCAARLPDVFAVKFGDEIRQFDDEDSAQAWVASQQETNTDV